MRAVIPYVICMLFFLTFLIEVKAFNVDWLPNDENAPLPLSSVYRARLKQLCDMTISNANMKSRVPVSKQKTLMSMCSKLRADEQNIEDSKHENNWIVGVASIAIIIMGFVGYNMTILGLMGSKIPAYIMYKLEYFWNKVVGKGNPGSDFGSASLHADSQGKTLSTEDLQIAKAFLAAQRLARFDVKQVEVDAGLDSNKVKND